MPVKYKKKKSSSDEDDISEEPSSLLTCPNDGCVKTFSSCQDLDDHSIIEDCSMKLEVSNRDVVKKKYIIKLEENIVQEEICLDSDTLSCTETHLQKGLALKQERKNKRFSEKQKRFLIEKFDIGLRTGRKEDHFIVAKEMRLATSDGKRLFLFNTAADK